MTHTKVFLTWSGERSNAVARALRYWLPLVIQNLDPWMSESDVDKGARWRTEIAAQLQETKIGIICLTPENLQEPWINFEAGALSKLSTSHACTYLFDLSPGQVSEPLGQFQATKAEREDTKQLLQTINKILGETGLSDKQLEASFEKWWPDLEAHFRKIVTIPKHEKPQKRSVDDMLEEVLQISRARASLDSAIVNNLGSLASAIGKLAETKVAPTLPSLSDYLSVDPLLVPPPSRTILSSMITFPPKKEKTDKDDSSSKSSEDPSRVA